MLSKSVLFVFLVGIALGTSGRLAAQEKPAEKPGPVDFHLLDPPVRTVYGAATLVGARDSLQVVALYRHGANIGVFIGGETAKPISKVRAAAIDRDQLVGIEDNRPIPSYKDNPDEWKSYTYLVAHAHNVPAEALAKAVNREVQYVNLVEQPSRSRGQVVHVSGRLKELRKMDAPKALWNEGIKVLYEGLIESDLNYRELYAVVLTDIPADAKTGRNLDVPVSCDAYFYKRWYLEDSKKDKRVRVPLLIGHSFKVRKDVAATADDGGFSGPSPIYLVIVGLTLAIAFIFLVMLNFRRGDRVVRMKLNETRAPKWVDPSTVEQPPSPPVPGVEPKEAPPA